MRIERLDPLEADPAVGAEFADVVNAAQAVDAPQLSPTTPANEVLYLRYGWENRPPDAVFVARDDTGRIVGRTYVELPLYDNLDIGVLGLECHPDHRVGEVPQALLDAGLAELRKVARTSVLVDAWADGFWRCFYIRNGFTVGSHAAQRRLWMRKLDWATLDRLHAESLEASADYDVVEMPIPTPDRLVPGLLDLRRAMNDAPIDDLAIEDEVWTPERSRSWELAQLHRRIQVVRLLAVRRSDGALGGFTVLMIEDERPTLGFQDDTGVVGEHRGHRLGLRLKIEMLRMLRDRFPAVDAIDTWNAESNDHMLAVNDALGCVVVGRGIDLQRTVN